MFTTFALFKDVVEYASMNKTNFRQHMHYWEQVFSSWDALFNARCEHFITQSNRPEKNNIKVWLTINHSLLMVLSSLNASLSLCESHIFPYFLDTMATITGMTTIATVSVLDMERLYEHLRPFAAMHR